MVGHPVDERPAAAKLRMVRLRPAAKHVAFLVADAALIRSLLTEDLAHGLLERLGTVHHEEQRLPSSGARVKTIPTFAIVQRAVANPLQTLHFSHASSKTETQ